MPLTPGESDRLLLHLQASLAQRRRDRGLLLNVPEARALIADAVCEWARDGLTWAQARDRARSLLTRDDVLPGVPEALAEVRVEGRFDDGTRLVVVKDPFGTADEPVGADALNGLARSADSVTVTIRNEASTPIGLSSHLHLAEANPRLRMDRSAAFGMRLAIGTGETVWIPAGGTVDVPVRPIGGDRIAVGTTGLVEGALDDPEVRSGALAALRACGYLDVVEGADVNTVVEADTAIAAALQRRAGS